MSPRVAYWTSAFETEMEAIASEVFLLRRRFPNSVAWGLNNRCWVNMSWQNGFMFNSRLHLLFRLATRCLEPVFQLNHIYGSLGDWFYLQGKKKRPTLLTVAAKSPPVDKNLLQRVDRFVVEWPRGVEELVQLGLDRNRIRVILPPVNLVRFIPKPKPPFPFTVLFASSPDKASWLAARGIPQLLDAAALRPHIRFLLLWRPWGDAAQHVQQWIEHRGLSNVELKVGKWQDMAPHYQEAHVCIAPFTDPNRVKPMPNSIIESLACGRPVLVTPTVGMADNIRDNRCGQVCSSQGEDIAEKLDQIFADWDCYSKRAREFAERHFGVEQFLQGYEQVYREILHHH